MGRVIKEDEQPDVTTVSFEENSFTKGAKRIPSEEVSTSSDAEEDHEEALQGEVLRDQETRWRERPVTVDAQAVEADPSPDEASSPVPEDDASEEGEEDEPASATTVTSKRSDAEWQERLEEAVEEARTEGYEDGYEAGYDDGYEEAEETLHAEYDEKREALLEDITRFDELWESYIDESETMLVELALQLAEAIVDAPLTDSIRRASEEALSEAVADLANAPPVTVTVHPVDYQRLHESGLADRLREKYDDLHLESDPECTEGDWSVSSPDGAIRRLRSEVMDTLRSRLSLAPSDSSSEGE